MVGFCYQECVTRICGLVYATLCSRETRCNACTLIGVVVSACIRRCMRSSVREFMTAATHAAATSKLQPELKLKLELMY